MSIEGVMWQEGWMPTNDIEVGQLLKLLKDSERETNRLTKNIRDEIAMLEEQGKELEEKHKKLESRIAYFCEKYVLEEVDEEDKKETATTTKYKVARGEIVINKPSRSIVKPTKDAEIYLSAEYPQFVKQEPKFKWDEFKKNLEITEDGKVYNNEAKAYVDIPIAETPQTVKIKLK